MITYVDIPATDIMFIRATRQNMERVFHKRAGWSATPIARDGVIWERNDHDNSYRAWCDIPSPEGMLL